MKSKLICFILIVIGGIMIINTSQPSLSHELKNTQNTAFENADKSVDISSALKLFAAQDKPTPQEAEAINWEDIYAKSDESINLNNAAEVDSLNQKWLMVSLPHYNVHFLSGANYNVKVDTFKNNLFADHWKDKPNIPHFRSYKEYIAAVLERTKQLENGYDFQKQLFNAEPRKKIDVYYTATQQDLAVINFTDNIIEKFKDISNLARLTQNDLLQKINPEVFKEVYWQKTDELATLIVNDYKGKKIYNSLYGDLRKLYDEVKNQQDFEVKLRVNERKKIFNQVLINNPEYFVKLFILSDEDAEKFKQSIYEKLDKKFNIDITDGPFCNPETIAYYYALWNGDTSMDMHEGGHLFQFALSDKNKKENKYIASGASNWVHESLCSYMQSRTGEAYDAQRSGKKSDYEAGYLKNPESWYYIGKYRDIYELKQLDFGKYKQAFYYYIEKSYGLESLRLFVQNIFAGKTPDEAAKITAGKNIKTLDAEMNKYYYGK